MAFSVFSKTRNTRNQKIFITFALMFLLRFGNSIPLMGIDQEALKRSFFQLENRNALMQILNMYSGNTETTLVSSFSLGIIPYINASILIDLLTTLVPSLEKLQSEEGEAGRRKLTFYKKIVTLLFAIIQSGFFLFYIQSYLYVSTPLTYFLIGAELVTGSMLIVWLTNIIDTKGLGNGTSLVIFTNIVVTLLNKNLFVSAQQDPFLIIEIIFLLFLFFLLCITQGMTHTVPLVSARQLAFLGKSQKGKEKDILSLGKQAQESGLVIRLNQAGIFPIIIASNLLPFFSLVAGPLFQNNKWAGSILFYLLIIVFNYFYTLVFWDPEKIAEQLRKSSVSVVGVTPGKETVSHLEEVVKGTSLVGGIFLVIILLLYDVVKQILQGALLNQLNISSIIILVGVAYELQKTIRSLDATVSKIQTT